MVVSKRLFLKLALIGAGTFSIQSISWSKDKVDTLALLQEDLFPKVSNKLNIKTINARAYLSYIMRHPRVSYEDKLFIKKSVKWLDEEAQTLFNKNYTDLSLQNRQNVLSSIAKTKWGENFIETILIYIFEALFGDPVYGINKDEIGWKWVKHNPGLPRPINSFKYILSLENFNNVLQ